MRLAIVLVHYRAACLATAAIEALRRDLSASGLDPAGAEWLVVDNGNDTAGVALLETVPVRRVDPGRNLGFAGGVNLGVAETRSEHVLVLNPDVLTLPGCTAALLAELERDADVVGPRFFWDSGKRMLLPPADPSGRGHELEALFARHGAAAARWARRRWRRHARRHWQADRPLASTALSGALLAFRRSAWERIGPFDEGYRLYFEETDWLKRAAAAGLVCRYVPAAEAIHLHNQSAAGEPRAAAWFEESAARFRRQHYGRPFTALLGALDRRLPAPRRGSDGACGAAVVDLDPYRGAVGLWVEVSPNPEGCPAAGEPLQGPVGGLWRLPREVEERLSHAELWWQVSDESGRELERRCLHCGDEGVASGGGA